jgi:hypothetical protein
VPLAAPLLLALMSQLVAGRLISQNHVRSRSDNIRELRQALDAELTARQERAETADSPSN